MIAQQTTVVEFEVLSEAVSELNSFVQEAAEQGTAAHVVERKIFERLLRIGRLTLGQFFHLQGTGDLGESVTLPDGREVSRFEQTHGREYVSIFDTFHLERTVYGTREGQKIEFIPLDARLELPASKFSYVLQDWDQMITTEQPYIQVSRFLDKILGLRQHVDSLERMSRQMTDDADDFCWSHEPPPADEEGEILVESADGKGVPIRHPADAAPIYAHQHKSGPKPDRKKMATVATVYTVDRFVRTPQEVVDALFRVPEKQDRRRERPRPQHKRVYARLSVEDAEGIFVDAQSLVLGWMDQEVRQRRGDLQKETVRIMDGQESLWEASDVLQDDLPKVDILDLLHVTPRLWDAAHVFHKPQSKKAEAFVRSRVLQILQGRVLSVVRGLRRMASLHEPPAAKRKTIVKICRYFENNSHRMCYDQYLSKGYPIASGAIEGACRYVVKDRLERTGMNWTKPGAQAVLSLRAIYVGGHWDSFIQYRIEREAARLYPHREILGQHPWSLAL
jgi:hypothetical protein